MDILSNVKGVKLVHMNTRSLYRKLDELRLLYSEYDFLCCSETRLDDRYSNGILYIDNIKIFRLDRMSLANAGYLYNNGGGVCIYVMSKWVPYATVCDLGTLSSPDFEILTLKINKPNFKRFFVSVVYKPPRGDSKECMDFIKIFLDQNPHSEYWILGAFNVDYLKRNIASTKSIINSIRTMGLNQLIKHVTRSSAGKGTCIDWIITNSNCDSPDDKWSFVLNAVRDVIHVMCPLKKIYVRKKQPIWFHNELYKLIKERERLSRLFRNTGDRDVLRDFKIARNRTT